MENVSHGNWDLTRYGILENVIADWFTQACYVFSFSRRDWEKEVERSTVERSTMEKICFCRKDQDQRKWNVKIMLLLVDATFRLIDWDTLVIESFSSDTQKNLCNNAQYVSRREWNLVRSSARGHSEIMYPITVHISLPSVHLFSPRIFRWNLLFQNPYFMSQSTGMAISDTIGKFPGSKLQVRFLRWSSLIREFIAYPIHTWISKNPRISIWISMIFGCQSLINHTSVDIHIDIQAGISFAECPCMDIRR